MNVEFPPVGENEYAEVAWAVQKCGHKFDKITIARPQVFGKQVKVEVLYSTMSQIDSQIVMNIAGGSVYPLVPGHECVGIVATIGEDVTELRIGDTVGVGPVIDSCGICENCKKNNEYLCEAEFVRIVGGKKSFDRVAGNPKTLTAGAFSGSMVVHENFVIKLPAGMNLERTAPLLASGLTVYEPLKKYMKLGSSVRAQIFQVGTVGVLGLGGLGSLAIKLAKALGYKVVAVSSRQSKEETAKQMGADEFVAVSDKDSMQQHQHTCDLIIDTISVEHDLRLYMSLLAPGGTIVTLYRQSHKLNLQAMADLDQTIAGSSLGSFATLKELLQLCQENSIYPIVETMIATRLDEVFEKLATGKDMTRFYTLDVTASRDPLLTSEQVADLHEVQKSYQPELMMEGKKAHKMPVPTPAQLLSID